MRVIPFFKSIIHYHAVIASATEIYRDAAKALQKLYAKSSKAKALGKKAKAILVFPSITKAGLMVGGQCGECHAKIRDKK